MQKIKYLWYTLLVGMLTLVTGCAWDWSRWPWSAE